MKADREQQELLVQLAELDAYVRGLDRIALSEVTIADLFHDAGYRTGLVGKWHNGALDPRFHPNARGFDDFAGFSGGGSYYYDYALDLNGTKVEGDGRYLTDVFTEHAVAFVVFGYTHTKCREDILDLLILVNLVLERFFDV